MGFISPGESGQGQKRFKTLVHNRQGAFNRLDARMTDSIEVNARG